MEPLMNADKVLWRNGLQLISDGFRLAWPCFVKSLHLTTMASRGTLIKNKRRADTPSHACRPSETVETRGGHWVT
jgi:hypothetical protein